MPRESSRMRANLAPNSDAQKRCGPVGSTFCIMTNGHYLMDPEAHRTHQRHLEKFLGECS